MPDTSRPARVKGAGRGLPPEQVQTWLDAVRDDLGRVRVRLQYLQLEEQRLAAQHRLLVELLVSSLDAR